MRSYRFQAVFASFMAITISLVYVLYRKGFDTDIVAVWRVLGLALFIHFASLFVLPQKKERNWWQTDSLIVIYTLLGVGLVGFLIRFLPFVQILVWGLAGLGYLMALWAYKNFFKEAKRSQVMICFVTAILIGAYFVNEHYAKIGYTHAFQESIAIGSQKYKFETIDISYHSVLSKMYQTYQTPTTGVDGVVFMHYNTATHWLTANLALLLDIPTWLFYNLAYQVIFFSLFFRLLASFASDLQNYFAIKKNIQPSFGVDSWQFWILVGILFVPVPNNMYMAGLLGYHFVMSSPYTIAICLVWAFLTSIIRFIETKHSQNLFFFIFLPIILFMIGFSHVATIVIFTACIGYYFLRFGWYRKIQGWLVIAMTITILFTCYMLTAETTFTGRQHSYEGSFGWFFFFKQHEAQYFTLIFIFYAILYIATFLYLKNEKLTIKEIIYEKKAFVVEWLWIAALAGLAPNIILQLYGSTGMYFLGLHKWLCAAFILGYVPFVQINYEKYTWAKYIKIGAVGLAMFIFLGKLYKNVEGTFQKDLALRSEILGIEKMNWKLHHFITKFTCCQENWNTFKVMYSSKIQEKINQNEFYQIIKSWEKLDKQSVSIKKESLLYIAYKDVSIFRDSNFSQGEILMIAPYTTGIATIRGLPAPEQPLGAYGYSYFDHSSREKTWKEGYSVEELKQIAKAQRAKYLWIYSFKTKDFEKITL